MAAPQGVSAGEGDYFSIVETHAAEDGAEVGLLFGAVGEAAVGGAEGDVAVGAAGAPGNGGTLHFLDGGDAGEGPEVGVGYPGELFCGRVSVCGGKGEGELRDGLRTFDGLEEVSSSF